MTQVFLSGGFGNIGKHILTLLYSRGFDVTVFDVRNKRNEKARSQLDKSMKFGTLWGDLRQAALVKDGISQVKPDIVLHAAAVIAPTAYVIPEIAFDVNVNGTKNLIAACENLNKKPKFIFVSSYAVYGYRNPHKDLPPLSAETPVDPMDNYGRHKVVAENMLHDSQLEWTVCRLPLVMPTDMTWGQTPEFLRYAFLVPLDRKQHLLDSRDAALGLVNAIEANTTGKTYLLGGSADCRVTAREYLSNALALRGISMFPDEVFRRGNPELDHTYCYEDFVEPSEAQAVLQFQEHSYADYLNDISASIDFMTRNVTRLLSPIIINLLKKRSAVLKNPDFDHNRTTWELICEEFGLDLNQ